MLPLTTAVGGTSPEHGLYRPAVQRYPVDPLSLPDISQAFGEIRPRHETTKWAELALRCVDSGIITDDDANCANDPIELVKRGLGQWSSRITGGLPNLACIEMNVSVMPDAIQFEEKFEKPAANQWYWSLEADGTIAYTLKEKVTALDETCPGLGETALHYLDAVSFRTWLALTPSCCRSFAENEWWCGASTDEDYEECFKDFNGEEPDREMRVFPSEYDAAFPKNVLSPKKVLDDAALKGLTALDGPVAEVARTLLDISRDLERDSAFPSMEDTQYESVYFSAILRWDDSDPILSFFDDWINSANQNCDCYVPTIGVDGAELDAAGFDRWKTLTENGFALLSHLDKLVGLLGTPH